MFKFSIFLKGERFFRISLLRRKIIEYALACETIFLKGKRFFRIFFLKRKIIEYALACETIFSKEKLLNML